jgi:hypothetical protein
MANYYTHFSANFMVPSEHRPLCDRLLKGTEEVFEKIIWNDEESDRPQFDYKWSDGDAPGTQELWIHSDESGNVEDVCIFVAYVQKRLDLDEPFVLSWANMCDRPRLDAFSGGAVVIHRGKTSCNETWQWIDKQLKKIKKSEEKRKDKCEKSTKNSSTLSGERSSEKATLSVMEEFAAVTAGYPQS